MKSTTKNYSIEKNRLNELRYFCLQYPIWTNALECITNNLSKDAVKNLCQKECRHTGYSYVVELSEDETMEFVSEEEAYDYFKSNEQKTLSRIEEQKQYYLERIKLIERCAEETDEELSQYIVVAVTKGFSYEDLILSPEGINLLFSRKKYDFLISKFFYILNKSKY